MKRAILTVGVSASGKSYWAEKQEGFQVICRDDIRQELLGFPKTNMWCQWDFKNEPQVTEVFRQRIIDATGDIIIADTNLNVGRLHALRSWLTDLGYTTTLKHFRVTYEQAVERDRKRVHSVGEGTIKRQWLQWLRLPENNIRKYRRNDLTPACVLVDVDGTVARMEDRGPYDWDKVGQDSCIWHVCKIVEGLAADAEIIFMSGRDGCCYEATYDWLQRFFPKLTFKLIMRPAGDMRKDATVKAELFFEHIEPHYNVSCVIDDRKQVIRMWTDIGLDVVQVGNYYEEF